MDSPRYEPKGILRRSTCVQPQVEGERCSLRMLFITLHQPTTVQTRDVALSASKGREPMCRASATWPQPDSFPRGQENPLRTNCQAPGTCSNSPKCKDPLFSWKLIFVGEVAIVVVLGGRKMPTSPDFNMVNVSVYACAGWPNYPMSSKIFHCNYHSVQWHLLLKGEPSAAGSSKPEHTQQTASNTSSCFWFRSGRCFISHCPRSLRSKCHHGGKVGNVCQAQNKAVNEYYSNLLSHNPLLSLN